MHVMQMRKQEYDIFFLVHILMVPSFACDRCGKTTLCHWCASLLGKCLFSINCHMHTEAADFLGGLRPVRNKSNTEVSSRHAY